MKPACRFCVPLAVLAYVACAGCAPRPAPARSRTGSAVRDKNTLGDELLLACGSGRAPEAMHLISLGADVNARDGDGGTPLYYAARWPGDRMEGIVELLVQRGADVNARWKDGFTPLHAACTTGSADCVKFLLLHGADVRARERNYDDTPLHVLCGCGSRDLPAGPSEGMRIALMLLGRGAKLDALDKDGKTPLDLAKSASQPDETLIHFMIAMQNAGKDKDAKK